MIVEKKVANVAVEDGRIVAPLRAKIIHPKVSRMVVVKTAVDYYENARFKQIYIGFTKRLTTGLLRPLGFDTRPLLHQTESPLR